MVETVNPASAKVVARAREARERSASEKKGYRLVRLSRRGAAPRTAKGKAEVDASRGLQKRSPVMGGTEQGGRESAGAVMEPESVEVSQEADPVSPESLPTTPLVADVCESATGTEAAPVFPPIDVALAAPAGPATGTVEAADSPGGNADTGPAGSGLTAGELQAVDCLRIFRLEPDAVVLFWRLERIDEKTASHLGAACKEILTRRKTRRVVFDLSLVRELSTPALAVLIRFHNTLVHLEGRMFLVAGGIYMWWDQRPSKRFGGALALVAGTLLTGWFLIGLRLVY